MHDRISPRRACNQCGYTIKMSSGYHRLLIYNVKRTTKIDGMGPFKLEFKQNLCNVWLKKVYFVRIRTVTY